MVREERIVDEAEGDNRIELNQIDLNPFLLKINKRNARNDSFKSKYYFNT